GPTPRRARGHRMRRSSRRRCGKLRSYEDSLHLADHLLLLADHLVDIAILGDGDALARRGPLIDRVQPALEMRQPLDRHARPLVRAHPRPVRDVRDRVIAGEILVTLEALVEHLEQAADLALIALDRVRNLLGRVTVK